MYFKDRAEVGQLLSEKLKKYKDKKVVVYALPRGGVITAVEIARELNSPLDLVITRKISHPSEPEYAIAATAENGHIIGSRRELMSVDEDWLESEVEKQRLEALRRRKKYLHGIKRISPKGKIAILVDDGVATGLTLRVGILELKHKNPKKIVVAIAVIPKSVAKEVEKDVDELIALEIPPDDNFLGSVGGYYDDFNQVGDKEVIAILKDHARWLKVEKNLKIFSIKDGRLGFDAIDYDEP